jgi:hypothetical protein
MSAIAINSVSQLTPGLDSVAGSRLAIRGVPDEERFKDGRKVKFINQELPHDAAFVTAQLEGNEVVYSVVMAKAGNPVRREDVASHFKAGRSKKWGH